MTTQVDYSAEEWNLLLQAPAAASLFIIQFNPYSPTGAAHMMFAALTAIASPVPAGPDNELIQAVSTAIQAGQAPQWPAQHPRTLASARLWALSGCQKVAELLAQKVPEAEAVAFHRWLIEIAQKVALIADGAEPPNPSSTGVRSRKHRALELLTIALDLPQSEVASPPVKQSARH